MRLNLINGIVVIEFTSLMRSSLFLALAGKVGNKGTIIVIMAVIDAGERRRTRETLLAESTVECAWSFSRG